MFVLPVILILITTKLRNYARSTVEMEGDMFCSVMMAIVIMEMVVLKIVELSSDTIALEDHQIPLIIA